MKTLLIIGVLILASCSDDEPRPTCEALKAQLAEARDAIIDHQAKGSNGDPVTWEDELRKLIAKRDRIQGDHKVRCQ